LSPILNYPVKLSSLTSHPRPTPTLSQRPSRDFPSVQYLLRLGVIAFSMSTQDVPESSFELLKDESFGVRILASTRGVPEPLAKPVKDQPTNSERIEESPTGSTVVTEPEPPPTAFGDSALDALLGSLEEFINRLEVAAGLEDEEGPSSASSFPSVVSSSVAAVPSPPDPPPLVLALPPESLGNVQPHIPPSLEPLLSSSSRSTVQGPAALESTTILDAMSYPRVEEVVSSEDCNKTDNAIVVATESHPSTRSSAPSTLPRPRHRLEYHALLRSTSGPLPSPSLSLVSPPTCVSPPLIPLSSSSVLSLPYIALQDPISQTIMTCTSSNLNLFSPYVMTSSLVSSSIGFAYLPSPPRLVYIPPPF